MLKPQERFNRATYYPSKPTVVLSLLRGIMETEMRANGICRISAVVLKSGKEGQFEKEGYGQVFV